MLIVVGAMRQRLPQQANVVESDAKRALELLKRLVSLSDFGLRW
jgi:hypothetical protein